MSEGDPDPADDDAPESDESPTDDVNENPPDGAGNDESTPTESGGDESEEDERPADFTEAHFDERARPDADDTVPQTADDGGNADESGDEAPDEGAETADADNDGEQSEEEEQEADEDDGEPEDAEDGESEDEESVGDPTEDVPVGAGTAAPEPDSPEPVATGFGEEGAPDDQEMPLADHVEEMVRRLAVVIVILALVSGVALPFSDQLINFLWYSFLPGPPTQCVQAAAFPVNETGAATLVDVTNATLTNVSTGQVLDATSARLLAAPNATLANASAGTVVDVSNAALLGTNTTGALADVTNATLSSAYNATLVDATNATLENATSVTLSNATGSAAMGGSGEAACPRLYHPLALVFARLKMASLAGFIIALPAFVYETYLFMRPGLYPNERRYYLASVPTSLILAGIGLAFAYFLVLPVIFVYFLGYSQPVAEVAFGLTKTFNLILLMLGMFALIFQIPLFIMLAIMMGVTSRLWLERRRLYFWFGFAGIAFIFSPDPTGMAPFIVAATMVVLFEGTLLLLRWTGR